MRKHAIALGYFFLAVFCIYVSHHASIVFHSTLVTAATCALVVGGVFFVAASVQQLQTGKQFLGRWIRKAQEPPGITGKQP